MPIPITCVCGQSSMAADQLAGQSAACPNCGQLVLVPAAMPGVPMQQVPMQQVPMQQVPMQQVPIQQVPMQQVPMQQVPMQQVPVQLAQGQQPVASPEQPQDAPKKKKKKAEKQAEKKKLIIIASSAGGGALLLIIIFAAFMMSGGGGSGKGLPDGWVQKDFKSVYLSIAIPKGLRASEGFGSVYRVYRPLPKENSNAQYFFTFIQPISRNFDRERKIDQVLTRLAGDASFPKLKGAPRTDIQFADMEGVEFKQGKTTVMRILFWDKGAFVLVAKRATNQNNDNQVFLDSFKRIKGYGQ